MWTEHLGKKEGGHRSDLLKSVLLDRMGRPEEIADVVIHMVSRATEWIRGEGLVLTLAHVASKNERVTNVP